jgi:hypothetical protein
LRRMSYAQYLYCCNRLTIQLMTMVCWEMSLLNLTNNIF